MVSPPRRQRARNPFPTSKVQLAFNDFVESVEFAGGRLQSISNGNGPSLEGFGMVVDEIRERNSRLPKDRREIVSFFCELVQPAIAATFGQGQRVPAPASGTQIIIDAVRAVDAACTFDQVRRVRVPAGVSQAVRSSAQTVLRELADNPIFFQPLPRFARDDEED